MSHIRTEYLKATETPMSQRYRLLKDLPGYKAGTEFEKDNITGSWFIAGTHDAVLQWLVPMLIRTDSPTYAGWFAPIDPDGQQGGRWRAGDGRQYWYVLLSDEPVITSATEDYTRFDGTRHKSGNYFRTREQAEAAAERIRKVLAEYQEELKDV